MRIELEEKLYKTYPEIFGQVGMDMSQTAMCWGCQCGDGWYNILDDLCAVITEYCKLNNIEIPQVSTIKEKYGTLSFYINGDDTIWSYVDKAEHRSEITCEVCGMKGENKEVNGWWSTRCDDCRKAGL